MEYPAGSGIIQTITPTTNLDSLFYDLTLHPEIAANGGINGTYTADVPEDRIAIVTLEIMTDCDFVSGSTLFFEIGGAQPCGERAIGDQSVLISDNLVIPEADSLYDANVAINTQSLDSICSSSADVCVQIFITGGNTVGSDTSTVTLPVGATMDSGTFMCSSTFCPTIISNTTINNQQVLLLDIPTGMSSGDFLDFCFQVTVDTSLFSQGDSVQVKNTTVLNNIACGNSFCSSIPVITGQGNSPLNIDQALGVLSITGTDLNCFEAEDGTATATPSGGNQPYSYQWSDGSTNATATGLSAGVYTVIITDVKGCVTTSTTTIGEPLDISASLAPTGPNCNGNTNGLISITPSGGTPGYIYQWNTGATTQTISGLAGGTYTVSITDTNGCLKTASTILTEPDVLSGNIIGNNVNCHNHKSGSAATVTTGGTLPYNYQWDAGAYNQTGHTAYGLCAGTYEVTISDANNCITTNTVTITEPTELEVLVDVTHVTCPWAADGSITLNTYGGTPSYHYLWDDGQTTATITGLSRDTFRVTVMDSLNCSEIVLVVIDTLGCDPCIDLDICVEINSDPNHPLSTLDSDGDGVTNGGECTDGTDPCDPCDFIETSITLPVTADQSDCPNLCPDLSPIMTILPGNIAGFSAVEVAVEVFELNNVDTDGSIIFLRMPSDPRFAFVWNIGLTMAALVPVQNPEWNYLGDNGIVHQWTYNGPNLIIDGGDKSAFGFQSFYDPQATDGQTTLTITVLPFSGGECNILNNTDSERLVYFE